MVIVIAEGAGQEFLAAENSHFRSEQDASENKLLQDVGLWVSHKISLRSNLHDLCCSSDNVYCTILAQSCVHGAMAGYTGFTTGIVNGRRTYLPLNQKQNKVVVTDI